MINIKNNDTKVFISNDTVIADDEPITPLAPIINITVSDDHIDEAITEALNKTTLMSTTVEITTVNSTQPIIFTEKIYTTPSTIATTKIPLANNEHNETKITSHEYEDEEEEDEGFSFGSVLKLLLSDNYETTTTAPYRRKTTTYIPRTTVTFRTTTTATPPTTRRLPPKPILPFIPMPHHSYAPPKKTYTQNTVNRIDHLVLGEATSIKKTTPRPVSTSYKPMVSTSYKPIFSPKPIVKTTTQKPYVTTRYTSVTKKDEDQSFTPVHEGPRPSSSSALPLPGILKLAGCNIYGRMYRVGRIITELSTPCQECWCTELGVQCNSLNC